MRTQKWPVGKSMAELFLWHQHSATRAWTIEIKGAGKILAGVGTEEDDAPELELQDDDRFSDEEESAAAEHRPKSVPPPAPRQPDQSVAVSGSTPDSRSCSLPSQSLLGTPPSSGFGRGRGRARKLPTPGFGSSEFHRPAYNRPNVSLQGRNPSYHRPIVGTSDPNPVLFSSPDQQQPVPEPIHPASGFQIMEGFMSSGHRTTRRDLPLSNEQLWMNQVTSFASSNNIVRFKDPIVNLKCPVWDFWRILFYETEFFSCYTETPENPN